MNQKPAGRPSSSEQVIKDIKRNTHKQYGAEEKNRSALDGLRGEDSIAEMCRHPRLAEPRSPAREIDKQQSSGCNASEISIGVAL
jgi:hypothetical protein